MENNRRDVIVIFAGYPQKMKTFLEQNEGLRSRITFHIDFPDYKPTELLAIMEKMIVEKGFNISTKARVQIKELFAQVHKEPDFGNGRYVRNVLEQAILKQSSRILQMPQEKLDKDRLFLLELEDFQTNIQENFSKKQQAIGFI